MVIDGAHSGELKFANPGGGSRNTRTSKPAADWLPNKNSSAKTVNKTFAHKRVSLEKSPVAFEYNTTADITSAMPKVKVGVGFRWYSTRLMTQVNTIEASIAIDCVTEQIHISQPRTSDLTVR